MATLKTIPIHDSKGIKRAIKYVTDEEKTKVEPELSQGDISDLLDYAENTDKTLFELDGEESVLVSGFNCTAESAPAEFMKLKLDYENKLIMRGIDPASRIYGKKSGKGKHEGELVDKEAREAYHVIMSFPKRDDLSPQMVHRIGLEFCERAFPDTKAVVSTHMNTDHLHNHIVRSAYNISTDTKYRDTTENLEKLRSINDELSLKYGLEIILNRNVSDIKGHSWYETMQRENGTSWKEVLKADIKKSIELAGSWEEYKNIMTRSGYGVTEKGKTVVYSFLNDENKRIRENRLGSDYTRENIREVYGQEPLDITRDSKNRAKTSNKDSTLKVKDYYMGDGSAGRGSKGTRHDLYVSRYTLQGRRRSDLELLFLAAIKVINYYKDTNQDSENAKVFTENPVYQPYYIKLKTMQESLNMTYGLGVRDAEHLSELKRNVGAKLSAREAELRSMENNLKKSNELCDKVKDFKVFKELIEKRGLDNIDVKVLKYSAEVIKDNYAKFNPMTPSQRRELYTKLSDSFYRVTEKYDSISYKEGQAILDFINGKSDSKPDILITEDEYHKHQRLSYYEAIRHKRDLKSIDKYGETPVSGAQLKAIEKIKEKHPELTITPENMHDAIRVITYFNAINPFGAPLASEADISRVKTLIVDKGLSLSREHLTVDEVKNVEVFISGKVKNVPLCLRPYTEMKDYQKEQLIELMELKGVESSISVSELSSDDYYRFFEYLLYKDVIPDVLKEPAAHDTADDIQRKNLEFEQNINNLSSDDQGLLYRYRAILNDLSAMGYDESSFDAILNQGVKIADIYNSVKQEVSDLKWEYRNYSHLEWNMNLAKNKAYIRGVKFEDKALDIDINLENEVVLPVEENVNELLAREDDVIVADSLEKSGKKFNLKEDMFTLSDYYE